MADSATASPAAKPPGIATFNEGTLHSNIKKWYAEPGDLFEAKIDGYIIDLFRPAAERDSLLIEVQTGNFTGIRRKLTALVKNHKVRLLYPIAREKWITKISPYGEIISRKKSPKKGHPIELFNELIRIPDIINHDNFSLEILMIKVEEYRCADGRGSWRRGGVSIKDRRLLEVYEQIRFNNKKDLAWFIPDDLKQPFSNKILAQSLGRSVHIARKMTYCLKKTGVIKEAGKNRNELLFTVDGHQ